MSQAATGGEDDDCPPPLISVCIVTSRRGALLDACLASLQAQELTPPFELLVGSNADPGSAEAVLARVPGARYCSVEERLPGAARNVLVERARGELLLFLDDDVVVKPDLLRQLADLAAARPDVTVFGGPNETPPGSSRFQYVQGCVLASLIGSGPVRRRYGRHPPRLADERFFTLCNLAVRRRAMLPFAQDLVCAEENAVLAELHRQGCVMLYDPDLVVFHERRATTAAFAAQAFKYGRGRGQLLARDPRTFRPAFVIPAVLVIYLGLAPVLARLRLAWLRPLAAYGLVVAAGSAGVAWTLRQPAAAPLAAALIVVLHLGYGSGVLRGLLTPRRSAPVLEAEPARVREREG